MRTSAVFPVPMFNPVGAPQCVSMPGRSPARVDDGAPRAVKTGTKWHNRIPIVPRNDPTQVYKMKPDLEKVLDEAMQLEPGSRALIAEALLESLDLGADVDVSGEWREEIRRRCEAIDQDAIDLVPGDQVLADLRRRYG